jgi:SAM-dependent methyltransferase
MRFDEFVRTKLSDLYEALRPIYLMWSGGKTDSCLSYFQAHWPRFECMLSVLQRHGLGKGSVAELGSFLPYVAYHLECASATCYDILFRYFLIPDFQEGKYSFRAFNLCHERFPEAYDLVILSEVIEHLPCNLFDMEKRVLESVKPGGHLLVTYPMHGHNAQDYDKDFGAHEEFRHEHLREFNESTVPLFFKTLTKVDEADVRYPAYGHIRVVLYHKAEAIV